MTVDDGYNAALDLSKVMQHDFGVTINHVAKELDERDETTYMFLVCLFPGTRNAGDGVRH